jgi:hypothetical protein
LLASWIEDAAREDIQGLCASAFRAESRLQSHVVRWQAFADCCDVLPDVSGQIIDMVGVVRMIVDCGTAFGNSGNFTAKQKAKSQR